MFLPRTIQHSTSAGDRTNNPMMSGQPALHPEPQLLSGERKKEEEGDDLVEEGMSLHAVIGYYFSSSAPLFSLSLSPSHYLHPGEHP